VEQAWAINFPGFFAAVGTAPAGSALGNATFYSGSSWNTFSGAGLGFVFRKFTHQSNLVRSSAPGSVAVGGAADPVEEGEARWRRPGGNYLPNLVLTRTNAAAR